MLEELLAYHCAPALAGIKPSNIVNCRKSCVSDIIKETERLNIQLNQRGIYIEPLFESSEHILLIVYRKTVLKRHLQIDANKNFLKKYGYEKNLILTEYLDILRSRLDCDCLLERYR